MSGEKVEWVEIIEPKTKEHMYANLATGECVWDPPAGVPVKKTDNKQWWELFDHNTGRFYYYNATSQKTVWHRPPNCDIIPLAKLQTLKQNTEPSPGGGSCGVVSTPKEDEKKKETVSTQTPGRSIRALPPANIKLNTGGNMPTPLNTSEKASEEESASSPRTSRPHHHHHHHHRHQDGCRSGDSRNRRGSQSSWRRNAQSQDSGRSSDSSSVSVCRQGGEIKPALAPSPSTPLLKKRSPSQAKANSFDTNISIGGGYSLGQENRVSTQRPQRILTGSASNHGISRSHSFAQRQRAKEEEEAMHEKYFIGDQLDKEISSMKNSAPAKLSPEYSNFIPPPLKLSYEHSSRPLRETQSDIEDSNGAWGTSNKKQPSGHSSDQETGTILELAESKRETSSLDDRSQEDYGAGLPLQPHIIPLHRYIVEQAKSSGCYRFGQLPEEETDSLNSDDDDGGGGGTGKGHRDGMDYDSDEFADDEAVSNQESSSEEDDVLDELDPDFLPTVHHHVYINTSRGYIDPPHYSDTADYADTPSLIDHSSSLYCNTRVSQHTVRPITNPIVPPHETQHTSLKRTKDPPAPQLPPLYSPILERSELGEAYYTSAHSLPNTPSPMSTTQYEQLSRLVLNREKKLPSDSDIEKYAQDNLNIHKKGIFRKKFSVRELLSWSKDPIRKPMLVLSDKALKKEATEVFKMVQTYMGDRKGKQGSSPDAVLLDICLLAHAKAALRDELYIQICRQTTENPRKDSLRKGWELMAICLYFFPPSPKFQAYLEGYMNRHRDPSYDFPEVGKWPIHVQVSHYASVACKRLQRIGVHGKRPIRKPTLEEIEQARLQIFRPSMFGSTLEEVMALQKGRFPHYKLPWVQTTLSDEVLRLQGTHTEGIFRVSADVDEVSGLKQQLDRWERPTEYTDAHTPASLLKLWYRELYEPLIPDSLYEDCISCSDDPSMAGAIVDKLPPLNRMVLAYLIRFLQIFARPEVVAVTKMDASNLAMVMAPNCLRCYCDEPRIMYENARKEMAFIRTLILNMDTAFMTGIL
ncbi:rho GTPase-activating protein 39 isoform X1 [Halyomorpha halys]|uniref:rho GTPase-activating protein 39 isoform X1 n=1 Tax=Halyomorpha halys TaxID=286706 RepID=UPI0006D4E3E2|nr:rho GTPase-activating protein 39 isoform X1 [Halyomorpha halys]